MCVPAALSPPHQKPNLPPPPGNSSRSAQGVYIALEKRALASCTVTATTPLLVATWELEGLNALASRCGPAVAAFWRNFALCQ